MMGFGAHTISGLDCWTSIFAGHPASSSNDWPPKIPYSHVMPSSGCDCLGPLLAVVSTGKDWEMVTEQVNRLMVNQ